MTETCRACGTGEVEFVAPGRWCSACWWRWWLREHPDDELREIAAVEEGPFAMNAAKELEMRKARRAMMS